jgi:hypothetical protein
MTRSKLCPGGNDPLRTLPFDWLAFARSTRLTCSKLHLLTAWLQGNDPVQASFRTAKGHITRTTPSLPSVSLACYMVKSDPPRAFFRIVWLPPGHHAARRTLCFKTPGFVLGSHRQLAPNPFEAWLSGHLLSSWSRKWEIRSSEPFLPTAWL